MLGGLLKKATEETRPPLLCGVHVGVRPVCWARACDWGSLGKNEGISGQRHPLRAAHFLLSIQRAVWAGEDRKVARCGSSQARGMWDVGGRGRRRAAGVTKPLRKDGAGRTILPNRVHSHGTDLRRAGRP